VFSSGPAAATNATWATRELLAVPLAPGAAVKVLDGTLSHYAVLAAGRKEDDDPKSAK